MVKKQRSVIAPEVVARVLFAADRTCCVCRVRLKPVQIHHLDDDPGNNSVHNLAVLCFDCHRETQITGGFDRKLNADQVVLYRDDWARLVAEVRSRDAATREAHKVVDEKNLALAMSLAEIYREAHAYVELAIHYEILGNIELRDKYVDLALAEGDADDDTVIYLRGLQGRPDLIPQGVRERQLGELSKQESWSQRARALKVLGLCVESATDYVRSILADLRERKYFPAAFYLKELAESGLIEGLFEEALREARETKNLWWQVRALQELGWSDALTELVVENASQIDAMSMDGSPTAAMVKQMLAGARGEEDVVANIRKQETQLSTNRRVTPRAASPKRTNNQAGNKLTSRVVCDTCAKKKSLLGGKTCVKGHFTCKGCASGHDHCKLCGHTLR